MVSKKKHDNEIVTVANAYVNTNAKGQKYFEFHIDGKRYWITKASINDWRYSNFSGEYLVKEVRPRDAEVKATEDNAL